MTGLFVSTFYDSLKAQGKGYFSRKGAVYLFPFFETVVKNMIQAIRRIIFGSVQVKMQNRMSFPFMFQLLDGKPSEKFLFPTQISFQRRKEQALPKTSGTAKKIITSGSSHLID